MHILLLKRLICVLAPLAVLNPATSAEALTMNETTLNLSHAGSIAEREELVYGRRFGTALTLEVFKPTARQNGVGIILFLSEGWFSDRAMIEPAVPVYIKQLLEDGFTVFAVIHGSNPKYSVPENIEDGRRAVRFIRHNATKFGIDPTRLGAIGDSAGGHLSLMVGCDREPGDSDATDPVDRERSSVAVVTAFFPPTDFLNWGVDGVRMLGEHPLVPLEAAFAFTSFDEERSVFVPVTDKAERLAIARSISPITHVHADCAASLIVVGDADEFIPPQQSLSLAERMAAAGAIHRLIVVPGGGHDAETISAHLGDARAWFRQHLVDH